MINEKILPKMKKMPKIRKARPKALKMIYCCMKKLNFEGAKPYLIIEKVSGKIIAYQMSRYFNPAHDAFLKGYNLINNKAVSL